MEPAIVYRYGQGAYINLTNRCPTACAFCIKRRWEMDYRGSNLDLGGAEPSPAEIAAKLSSEYAAAPFREMVFCGYGEPAMRFTELKEVCRLLRAGSVAGVPRDLRVRLNTNGLADLLTGRDAAAELAGLVDSVHVSLNTPDPAAWLEMMRPAPQYAEKGFESVLTFIRSATAVMKETVATAVEKPGLDRERFAALARELGAEPRFRPMLEEENGG
ncbi:MAG: Radical SAM domain-containing protein [Elusimicrobia bacterium]|nr:MAG: Radical SAM domain-containing protein [Elusimicrobiota bacterium]KAF0154892.1 MAG: Radical SAM domain-containing protein [Elusimicrobiota bacterium]